MRISQAAFDLIVEEETGGKAYYQKTEQSTDWPEGASGVTIGIGFDCGYCTAEEIAADWGAVLPSPMIRALQGVAGIHGEAAAAPARALRDVVNVPWDIARQVFRDRDVPKWEAIVAHTLPNTNKLSGDCFGALVSLAFNRGASFHSSGDRYTEMRAIAEHMAAQQFSLIPAEFRLMKRLWSSAGLRARRDHEAALFEQGLHDTLAVPIGPAPVPTKPIIIPAPPVDERPWWLRLVEDGIHVLTTPIGEL